MRRFSKHSYLRLIGSLCAIVVLLASAFVTIHFNQARATSSLPVVNNPVIFLHGINHDGASDCSDWARAMTVLVQSTKVSFRGPLVRMGYYNKDRNCSQNLSQISSPNCIGFDGTPKKAVGTTNESIRHIACELAWYLYNTYTQNGVSVDMVTHSMGGLITRYALAAVAHGAKAFPSSLLVSNVVDMDTPNGGLPLKWYDSGIANYFLCNNCLQAVQMQQGNSFILELHYFAQDPQIKGNVTIWTLLSSTMNITCADLQLNTMFAIPLPSPLDMNGPHMVKVVYEQPYYCHNGLFDMQNAVVPDKLTKVQFCDGCAKQDAKNWQQWNPSSTFPDPLYEMLSVLSAQVSSPTPSPTFTPTTTPLPGTWNIISSPNPTTFINTLEAVSAVSSSDIWAVGKDSDELHGYSTLIEHWDGSQWSIVQSPSTGNYCYQELTSVKAFSANDVWAVGSACSGLALIEHWDGSQWSIVQSLTIGYSSWLKSLTAVSANDIWAVGGYDNSNSPVQPLIEHWDGSQWSIISSPNLTGAGFHNPAFDGIVALSANDIWAVGSDSSSSSSQTSSPQAFIEHWDGTQWSVVSSPSLGTENYLYAVSATATNDVWAVGDSVTPNGGELPFIEHWDGIQWSIVSSPNINAAGLYAVTAVSSNNAWAVGMLKRTAFIEHWNGTTWNVVPNPADKFDSTLYGVTAISASTILSVGDYSPADLIQTLVESNG